jgi:hypothetical protein
MITFSVAWGDCDVEDGDGSLEAIVLEAAVEPGG